MVAQTAKEFLKSYAKEVPQEVRDSAAAKLQEAGYGFDWQLKVMPRELLLTLLPAESMGLELTAVLYAQHMFGTQHVPGSTEVVAQLQQMIHHQRNHTAETKRLRRKGQDKGDKDDDSSSGTADDSFDAAECLKKYGMPSVEHGHLIGFGNLRQLVRTAQKAKKKAKGEHVNFIIDKAAAKCSPHWMKEKDQPPKHDMTHAHWVAAWSARTLSQLTVQAAVGQETVSFDQLLNQFLNYNRVAIEDTVKTAQCYDADLWLDLAEATKRKDKQCNPSQRLVEIDENMRTRARNNARYAVQGFRKAGGKGADKAEGKLVYKVDLGGW